MDIVGETADRDVAAVLDVIRAETEAFFNKDFEAFSRCWVHEAYIRRLGWWSRGGIADLRGWDALSERIRELMSEVPNPNRSAREARRENLIVRVSGDMAWATFDQYAPDTGELDVDMPGRSRETRVLERHNGEWRIAYHTFIHQSVEPNQSPMFRVDRGAQVSWTNGPAGNMVKEGKALTVRNGRLRTANEETTRKLWAAIAAAAEPDEKLEGHRTAIPILLDTGGDDGVCVCWVLTEGTGSGAVLVSINNLAFTKGHLEAAVAVFGLSFAQQRLAELLVAGEDLVQAARHLGVSINTARTQLQRIFEKTGVRSQLALVRLLLSVIRPDHSVPIG